MATKPAGVRAKVEAKLQHWKDRKSQLASLREHYNSSLPAEKREILGNLDLFLLEEMLV